MREPAHKNVHCKHESGRGRGPLTPGALSPVPFQHSGGRKSCTNFRVYLLYIRDVSHLIFNSSELSSCSLFRRARESPSFARSSHNRPSGSLAFITRDWARTEIAFRTTLVARPIPRPTARYLEGSPRYSARDGFYLPCRSEFRMARRWKIDAREIG